MDQVLSPSAKSISSMCFSEPLLEYEEPQIENPLDEHLFPDPYAYRFSQEQAIQEKAFGSEEWKKVFRVKIKDIGLSEDFKEWWQKHDVIYPEKLNSETHHMPVLIPKNLSSIISVSHRHRFAKYLDSCGYNLEVLKKLVEKTKKENPVRSNQIFTTLDQIGKIKSDNSYWVVARKEHFNPGAGQHSAYHLQEFMRDINRKRNTEYEELPSALDVSTVALVNLIVKGEMYFKDDESGSRTFSCCRDIITRGGVIENVFVGGQSSIIDEIGESAGLVVSNNISENDRVVVPGLLRFPGIRKVDS